jgi:PAS domain S-box-containing protein
VETAQGRFYTVILRDITEREQAVQALKESQERLHATFEQAAVGLSRVAIDGHWLQVNQRLCEITGYTQEELLERTFRDITYPLDLEAELNYRQQALAGELESYALEKRYIRKDGRTYALTSTV